MSLTLALNNAISGLNVNQRALATVSQNIANANTVGYTRKTVDQSSQVLGGNGAGVRIEDISRKVDEFLIRAVRSASTNMAQAESLSNYMERLQVYMGQPGQSNSLDSYVQTFFNQLQSLAETPEVTSLRSQTVASANQLALAISDLAYAIQNMRYEADIEIKSGIDQFNTKLRSLDTINTAIAQSNAYGSPSADLLDKRDTLLKDISEFMDLQVIIQKDGRAFLYTRNGQPILSESRFQLEYQGSSNIMDFTNTGRMGDIVVRRIMSDGTPAEVSSVLVKGGVEGQVDSSKVTGGALKGLLQVRDEVFPEFMTQLDQLAATMRDEFNAVHNKGSGFPGATSYTGTRPVLASDYTGFSGAVQIALLNADGSPYLSPHGTDQGLVPLTIDFSKLDGGQGAGTPTLQSIIDEINNYYGTPAPKVNVGNLSNIEISAISNNIPGVPPNFTFDFDLENFSGGISNFFVTDVAVSDDTGTDITNVTSTQPQVALDPAFGYTTTMGSNAVTITTSAAHGFKEGDVIYLGDPGASVNGISAAALTGYFTITNVTANGFEIGVQGTSATASGTAGAAGVTAMPPYHTVQTGQMERTGGSGQLTANLAGNTNSDYYDFTVTVGVVEADGSVSTSTITYRVHKDQNIRNDRFSANNATGDGTLTYPSNSKALLKATMVDENGVEIPTIDGKLANVKGYLKIQSLVDGSYVSFTDLGSSENGVAGYKEASNRNFFHYYELNNFFAANEHTATGDTVKGSASKFAVEQRLIDQPNLITTGQLTRSNQPVDPTKPPIYTYERFSGDNSLIQALAKIGVQATTFAQAGALPATKMTFSSYAGEMLGYFTEITRTAQSTYADQQLLLDGLGARADSLSGVNLDQELADTIIYQNAYTASARIITVTNELFGSLLGAFG
jgi:flagellar hook-associated protein FlgK